MTLLSGDSLWPPGRRLRQAAAVCCAALVACTFSDTARAQLTLGQEQAIAALSGADDVAAHERAVPALYSTVIERAAAYRQLGLRWEAGNDMDAAWRVYDRSVRLLEELPPSVDLVHSLSERSYIDYVRTGDTRVFCPDRERATAIARTLADPETLVFVLVRRAFCFESPELLSRGLADLQEAMQIAEDANLRKSAFSMIANAGGVMYRANGLHDQAYRAFADAYELWREAGDTQDMFNMLHAMTGEAIEVGRWPQAEAHVEGMFAMAASAGEDSDFPFFAWFNAARLALAQQRYADAGAAFDTALALAQTTSEQHFIGAAYLLRARSQLWRGNVAGAEADLAHFRANFDQDSAEHRLLDRLAKALEQVAASGRNDLATIMAELLTLERQKRYAFVDANTRVFTRQHNDQVARYEANLLKQRLQVQGLELERAADRGRIARQTTVNMALIALLLGICSIWLFRAWRVSRKRSHTDSLTGIANRGRVFERGAQMCERAGKRGESLAVIVFDLDLFKDINDSWGHDAGDRTIQHTVRAAAGTLSKGDLLGRLGGEEFIAVLPAADRAGAAAKAEEIRHAVAAAGFLQVGRYPIEFTVSLGVAHSEGGAPVFQDLVNRADTALYAAKRSGRNRVEIAP